jgi:hypothetical protein
MGNSIYLVFTAKHLVRWLESNYYAQVVQGNGSVRTQLTAAAVVDLEEILIWDESSISEYKDSYLRSLFIYLQTRQMPDKLGSNSISC